MKITRWTLVLRARGSTPEARAALAELCEAYYGVVEDFIRCQGEDPQWARDLAHEFIARILDGTGLRGADPGKGRFRSYLMGAVKHFLSVERARRGAAKRGGGVEHVSMEGEGSQTRPGLEIADEGVVTPEVEFDRRWATALLGRALDRLGAELVAEGKGVQYEVLKPALQGVGGPSRVGEWAKVLGMSEGAVKVAVHRLRRRFRETVRAEVAETLGDPAMVEEEMRYLRRVLGSGA